MNADTQKKVCPVCGVILKYHNQYLLDAHNRMYIEMKKKQKEMQKWYKKYTNI